MTFNVQQALIHALRQVITQPFESNHQVVIGAIVESLPELNTNTRTQMHAEIRIGLAQQGKNKTPQTQRFQWRQLQSML